MNARLSSDTRMARSWFQPTPDSLWNRFHEKPRLRLASLFNLVWTVYVFGDLVFAPKLNPHWWLATLTTFPLFLAIYAISHIQPIRRAPWFAAAVALLAYSMMGINASGGACFMIYACAMMGFEGSPKRCYTGMGFVIGGFALGGTFIYTWPPSILATISFIALSVGSINVIYR